MFITPSFNLPPDLPNFPQPKSNRPFDPRKFAREKIEHTAKAVLAGDLSADPMPLVRFFRIMSRDSAWMAAHPGIAALTLTAISRLYMLSGENPGLTGAVEKIRKYVQKGYAGLSRCASPDILVDIGGIQISCPALILACQSAVYDRAFRGGFKEACALRQYYALNGTAAASAKLPSVVLDVPPVVGRLYLDLVTKGSSTLALSSRQEEKAFMDLVDSKDSFHAVFPRMKEVMLRHIDENNIDKIWALVLREENERIPANQGDGQARAAFMAEHVFAGAAAPEIALTLYSFAKTHGLRNLKATCLDLLLRDLSAEEAAKGIVRGQCTLQEAGPGKTAEEDVLSPNDIKEYCLDWFLKMLPDAFAKLGHKIPSHVSVKATGVLHTLGASVGVKGSRDFNEAAAVLSRFKEIARHYVSAANPALRKLSGQELNWVLELLPATLQELDLSGCKISSGKALARFSGLKKLSLSGAEGFNGMNHLYDLCDLVSLDLTGCTGIATLDVHLFTRLTDLKLAGCNLDEHVFRGLEGCANLQTATIPSSLKGLFAQFPNISVTVA